MPTQYGAPNQVYQPTNMVMGQQKAPGRFEGWNGLQYLAGPVPWLAEAMSPGSTNKFIGSAKDFLLGSPQKTTQASLYTPEAQQMMSQLMQTGFGGLKQFDFGPIRDQAIRQYEQQIVPSLAERFTSMGGRRSSGFQQALGASGSNLMSNLAAQEENYNLQRQPMFQQLIGMGLRPQWENIIEQRHPGIVETLLASLAQGAGKVAGMGMF